MIIAPSLLAANPVELARELRRINRSGAEWLHLDIMDGHFVPNISFGPALVAGLRPLSPLFFDGHLMCSRPEILIEPFVSAGCDSLTIHVELGARVMPLIWKIRAAGAQVGLAVNPPTSMESVEPFLEKIDLLLVMTVNPGFGGQSFIAEVLPKIQQAQAWRRKHGFSFRLQVDGGINDQTARECAFAGADTFVSGTGLFKSNQMRAAVKRMRRSVGVNADSEVRLEAVPVPRKLKNPSHHVSRMGSKRLQKMARED